MSFKEQVLVERKTIIEWDMGCTGGGIDPQRAITSEILWMLNRLETPEGFDKMLSLNQRIENMRVLITKEENFDSFKNRKRETLDRLEASIESANLRKAE